MHSMRIRKERRLTLHVWGLIALLSGISQAAVLQVGTGGGITVPGSASSTVTNANAFTALTVVPANFGALYDSASGRVGGGTAAGHLYYAFTARSLDRAGNVGMPAGGSLTNTVGTYPYSPGTSFAGGQLIGASPSLSVSQAIGNYAHGYNIGTNGTGSSGYFGSPRTDMGPARVALFEVHVQYNASANDNATITMRLYDNLPGQRQPIASDIAVYTQTLNTASSDFSFSSFQFISGHADTTYSTRWTFSNAVFAENAGEAPDYLLAQHARALQSMVQVGAGGTTTPGAWTSGGPVVSNAFTALTVLPAKFGTLYDSASGKVGGGTVSGDLYYAFTARSLDRAGDTRLPPGSASYSPYGPSASFAGGQLVGAAPSLGVSQAYGNYALGYFRGANGGGGSGFFGSPRIDMAPARVCLFEVFVHFNASASDTATIIMSTYDNLPGQRQPTGSDTPTYTVMQSAGTGDYSFDSFQFISGHADVNPTRWTFSNVVFSRNATAAADYLLNPPIPDPGTFIAIF